MPCTTTFRPLFPTRLGLPVATNERLRVSGPKRTGRSWGWKLNAAKLAPKVSCFSTVLQFSSSPGLRGLCFSIAQSWINVGADFEQTLLRAREARPVKEAPSLNASSLRKFTGTRTRTRTKWLQFVVLVRRQDLGLSTESWRHSRWGWADVLCKS